MKYGGVPPVTATACEYGVQTRAAGRLDVVMASADVQAVFVGVMTRPERSAEQPDCVLVTRTLKVVGIACVPPATQLCRLKAESGMNGSVKVSDPLFVTVATTGALVKLPFVTAAVIELPKFVPSAVIDVPPAWPALVGLKLVIVGVSAW